MDAQIVTALTGVIAAVITVSGGFAVRLINQTFSGNQVALAKEFALAAVNHAEEIAPTLCINGAEKFQQATLAAVNLAAKVGIVLTEDQWGILINSALQKARAEWALVQGKTDMAQPIIVSPEGDLEVAPITDTPIDAPGPDIAVPDPAAPATPIAPVAPATPVIQSVLDAAQAAYNQVVQESIQALSVTK